MTSTDTAVRLQVLVERYKAAQSKVLLRSVKQFDDVVLEITRGEELSGMGAFQLNRVLQGYARSTELDKLRLAPYLTDLFEFTQTQIDVEAKAWGVDSVPSTAAPLAYGAPLGIDTLDRGKNVTEFIENWWESSRTFILGSIRRAAFEGKNNISIKEELRGTRRLNFNDGVLSRMRRNTSLTNSVAIQHLLSMARNVVVSLTPAKGILWNALFEKNTCGRCAGLDTQPFQVQKGPRSPLHPGCRCIMVPIMPDTNVQEMKTSYYQWLRDQDFDFIVEALGKTRAQVFVDGGLSVDRFAALQLDKKFEPLSLEEFRKVAPSAFKRAGV